MGVTRGTRMNGIVMTSATRPLEVFLRQVQNSAVLARFLRGFRSAKAHFHNTAYTSLALNPEIAYAEPNGHVVITPTADPTKQLFFPLLGYIGDLDPAVATLVLAASNELDLAENSRLLELASQDNGRLSELKVLLWADAANILPLETYMVWDQTDLPPFTVLPGDIGVYAENTVVGRWGWSTLDHCQSTGEPDLKLFTEVIREDEVHTKHVLSSIHDVNGRYTYELPHDFNTFSLHVRRRAIEFSEWKMLVARWSCRPQLISLCKDSVFYIRVTHRGILPADSKVYFHRCPALQYDPRMFWGYCSTNVNPAVQGGDLESMGWEFSYMLIGRTYRMVDDWGYKYKRKLAEGIRAIPGSFPDLDAEISSDEGED